MSENFRCSNQQMKTEGHIAYYNEEPKGKCHWFSTDTYYNHNCNLEMFNITQDCPTCPIKSPYGILQENPRDNINGFKRRHTTFVWNKLRIPKNYECDYKVIRKGQAL